METKICNICGRAKEMEEFRRLTGLKNKFNKGCHECIEKASKRYVENKDEVKAYQRAYRENNKEYFSEYRRKWGKENPDTLGQWANKRYDENGAYKDVQIARARLRGLIDKGFEFEALVGCTFSEFKAHMESLFQPGMTWANYGRGDGKWSIDHIVALSRADNEMDSLPYHFSNLQPLWCHQNSRKGNRDTPIDELK